ncbi:hypothetical protein L2E82_47703 [Cichorium intybus]|uniref:Uncharacterized protein n=1 Tax=Cichorium intybus TaxID=13427 RepID=A0ACB8YWB1_CICIN|nr:hypothetical protein L2E82_47703 [Cichorium intybus]
MPSTTVDEQAVVVHVETPAEANHGIFNFVIAFLFKFITHIVNHLKPPARIWINYFERIFGEEAVIMPSPFNFIITNLYALVEIKSQGSENPFQTHPQSMNVVVTSLLFYGLASAVEHFISATRLERLSVYSIIARLGKICCLCILVASLSSLFYL